MSGLYKRKNSPFYWCYYKDEYGKYIQKSTKCKKRRDAVDKLKDFEFTIKKFRKLSDGKNIRETTLADILQLYVDENDDKGHHRQVTAEKQVNLLLEKFGYDKLAIDVDVEDIDSYKRWRRNVRKNKYSKKKISNATINRDLCALRRAFYLALDRGKVLQVPKIELLPENNIRTGYFTVPEIKLLMEHLPEHISLIVWFGYNSGWRKAEILSLKWYHINLNEGSVYIEGQFVKNKSTKIYYMSEEMVERFRNWKDKSEHTKRDEYVFTGPRSGKKMVHFEYQWKKALKDAGLPQDRVFHDLRRSCLINMANCGIDQATCMEISGHKTTSVFHRYRIVNKQVLQDATRKLSGYLQEQEGQNAV